MYRNIIILRSKDSARRVKRKNKTNYFLKESDLFLNKSRTK